MLYRCYLVVYTRHGIAEKAVFLDRTKAEEYAAKYHGHVVKMMGQG